MSNQPIFEDVLMALRQIIRAIDLRSRKLSQAYGLTGPQLLVLKALSTRRTETPSQLAKEVKLSHATVTGILDRLAKRELISRVRCETDRRKVEVSIEKAGLKLLEDAPPLMQEQFIERFASLEAWEQTMMLSSVQRMAAMMEAAAVEVDAVLDDGPLPDEAAEAIHVMAVNASNINRLEKV